VAKDLFYPMPEDRLENFRLLMKAIVARYYGDEQEMWDLIRKREPPRQPYPIPPEMPRPKS